MFSTDNKVLDILSDTLGRYQLQEGFSSVLSNGVRPGYWTLALVVLGSLSHSLLFVRGEWHLLAPQLFWGSILFVAGLFLLNLQLGQASILSAIWNTALPVSAYLFGLFGEIAVYRAFFHRLRHFPGPFGAKISKFWHVFQCIDSKNHLLLTRLSKEYGPFIRTGPNEVTIVHPEAFVALHGPKSKCRKAVFYDIMKPDVALNTTRDRKEHQERRRVWDQAFSGKLMSDYRNRILEHARKLEHKVATTAGEDVNATSIFALFGTGIMVDLAFGHGSEHSENWTSDEEADWQVNVDMVRNGLSALGPLGVVPWLLQIGFSIPNVPQVRDWLRMKDWARACIEKRLRTKSDKPNISHWLIEPYFNNPAYKGRMDWLTADAFLVIIAGSDTVNASLNYICYHLASDRRVLQKLRAEIDAMVCVEDFNELQRLPYLNAVIEENLRLHPLVPTGLARETPPEGIDVDGTHIPGGVTVIAPAWSISRLESCFERANDFIPERWLKDSDIHCTPSASKPFNQSTYSCPGKMLAMNELRILVALLAGGFDMRFPDGYNHNKTFDDMRDCFVSIPGELRMIFEPRKR